MSRPIPPRRPVVEPVETRPRLLRPNRQARIAGVMAVALVISWGAPAASAYWQTLSSNNGGAGADAIVAVAAPTASTSAGAASVSWAASTTAAGRPVSGYTVARYSSVTGGTKVAAGGACAGTVTALTCSEAVLPAGTWYYTVTPVLAAWAGPESARSGGVTGDSTPPNAPTIVAQTFINSLDADKVPVSGTAEALSSVTITVADGAANSSSQTVTASSSGQWTAANFNLTAFNDGTITYSAIATDPAGNASALKTASSTKDTAAPTAKVTLVNLNTAGTAEKGDKVVISYSETMNASSICSAWTNNSLNYTINGNDLVTIQISPAKILTVSATGCPTLRIGDVALDGMYTGTAAPLVFGGGGGNVSSIAWNFTAKTLTLTLGKLAPGTQSLTSVGTGSPTVVPPSGVRDVAGNQAISAAPDAASRF